MSRIAKSFPIHSFAYAVLCAMLTACAIHPQKPPDMAEQPTDTLTAELSGQTTNTLRSELSEQLACFRLELMSMEKQQPAITSKFFCMTEVYNQKDVRPFWVTPEGPGAKAQVVLDFLKKAETEGLDPANYEVDEISELFTEREPESLARLDTLLTYNLIKYIHDARSGRLKPRYADPDLFAEAGNINFNPGQSLEKALAASDLAVYLASLPPAHAHYTGLKKTLALYRAIENKGGWPIIPAGPTIQSGDYDERIPEIIHRLSVTGDLDPAMMRTHPTTQYGPLLRFAIVKFQARQGLEPDGVIGAKTLAALNVSVNKRIKQIIINMARWRWHEHNLGERYILVNIAHFDLKAFEAGQEALSIPVIVGRFQQQTPVFSDRIAYIDINPYWNIPPDIARNEELQNLRNDPGYLVDRHIRLFSDWSDTATEIDSTTVDWSTVTPDRMGQFLLRQDPGPWNALGHIKFVFPNTYNVYLHDTPTQNLFSRNQRHFSHGCIRVSDPVRLAAFVLSRQKGENWNPETITSSINKNKRVVIRLDEPLPVHITYQTAWIDKHGIVCFNDDVYGRDEKLLKAFNE